MPEILTLDTYDWTLVVWVKNTQRIANRLRQTLAVRGKKVPATVLHFRPDLYVTDEEQLFREYRVSDTPLFFENTLYEFDFQFRPGRYESGSPAIKHRLQQVEDAFHYTQRGDSLRGSLNFRNDVGWFRLRLTYSRNGKQTEQTLSFEVWPSKMDLHTDMERMQQTIDRQYPLWRFALSNKTESELERSRKPHERFPLLWLAQFESLREELQEGIRRILNSPHSRLLSYEEYCRADRLKGRLHPRQEEHITADLRQAITHRRYLRHKRQLSVDTPENRFIKMVLQRCVRELGRFTERAAKENNPPENSRLSGSFFEELNSWKAPLQKQLNQPFFRELGSFSGLNGESLVLHQKTGYSGVYRVWQQLRMYLDVLGNNASVSVKSVAELYEVWCFLEVRRLLTEHLGFSEKISRKAQLNRNGLERSLNDGLGAAFEFERGDGVHIRLAHEPLISRVRNNRLRKQLLSWTTPQKPDILLEITLPDGQRLSWVFDAKYRIQEGGNGADVAPDDAINQMHRYRDAMIYADSTDQEHHSKSRPVFGAFVLYPGWFGQHEQVNPAQDAIDAVGIGSFPLLPGQSSIWLQQFLEQQLGKAVPDELQLYRTADSDRYFVQEAGRISYSGMQSVRYRDLTLVASLGPGRSDAYLNGFRTGTAQWYHTPVTAKHEKHRVSHFVMQEIRYCALVVHVKDSHEREIRFIYPVLSAERKKRSDITEEQSGSRRVRNPDEEYWLFRLGTPFTQPISVSIPGARDFKLRMTSLNDLSTASQWNELPDRYTFLRDKE